MHIEKHPKIKNGCPGNRTKQWLKMRQSWQNKIPLKTTRPNKRKLKLEVARKTLHKRIV